MKSSPTAAPSPAPCPAVQRPSLSAVSLSRPLPLVLQLPRPSPFVLQLREDGAHLGQQVRGLPGVVRERRGGPAEDGAALCRRRPEVQVERAGPRCRRAQSRLRAQLRQLVLLLVSAGPVRVGRVELGDNVL